MCRCVDVCVCVFNGRFYVREIASSRQRRYWSDVCVCVVSVDEQALIAAIYCGCTNGWSILLTAKYAVVLLSSMCARLMRVQITHGGGIMRTGHTSIHVWPRWPKRNVKTH